MKTKFLITELGKDSYLEKKSIPNEMEQKEIKAIEDNLDLSRISEIKDEVTLERSKHNILDYLIREETNFADLYKVEHYYKNLIIQHSKKYNNVNKLIKEKKNEIDYVQDLINREIIANIDLEKDEMIEVYKMEKERINKKINQVELDNECYEHIFKRLYRNNVNKNLTISKL